MRRLSRRESHASSSSPPPSCPPSSAPRSPGCRSRPASSTALPSTMNGAFFFLPLAAVAAPWMASALLGVEALPYLSVCVMKSGTGAAEEGAAASGWADAAAAMGVFCAPGLRRSALPRMPAGVLLWAEDAGVVVSV